MNDKDRMREAIHEQLTRCKNGEITIEQAINNAMGELKFDDDLFRSVMTFLGKTWIELYEEQQARLI